MPTFTLTVTYIRSGTDLVALKRTITGTSRDDLGKKALDDIDAEIYPSEMRNKDGELVWRWDNQWDWPAASRIPALDRRW